MLATSNVGGKRINKTRDFRIDSGLRFCGKWLETSKRVK